MDESIDSRIDRSAFSVVSLDEADSEIDYWLSRTPRERLEGIETTRQILIWLHLLFRPISKSF